MLSAAGCSSFDGAWLKDAETPSEAPEGRALAGIPLTMTKPAFFVTRVGEGSPEYNLTVKYVPDEDRRYTLNLDPGALADLSFIAKLGDSGELINTTGKSTDRVVPTIKALGTFVTNTLAAVSKFSPTPAFANNLAVDKLVMDSQELRNKLFGVDVETPMPEAAKVFTARIKKLKDDVTSRVDTSLEQQAKRFTSEETIIDAYIAGYSPQRPGGDICKPLKDRGDYPEHRDFEKKADLKAYGRYLSVLHYADDVELKCIVAARDFIAGLAEDPLRFVDSEDKLFDDAGGQAFENLRGEIGSSGLANDLKTKLKAVAETTETEVRNAISSARNSLATELAKKGKNPSKNAAATLDKVVRLEPAVWRARHILYLERLIAQAQLIALRERAFFNAEGELVVPPTIKTHRNSWAAAFNEAETLLQRKALLARLQIAPEIDGSGAYKDYNLARLEVDALTKQINDARNSTIDAGTVAEAAAPKLKDIKSRAVLQIPPACLKPHTEPEKGKKGIMTLDTSGDCAHLKGNPAFLVVVGDPS